MASKTRRAKRADQPEAEAKQPRQQSAVLRNEAQSKAVVQYAERDILFLVGPPGAGKSHVAVYLAWRAMVQKWIERIVVTRPVVECGGERLGFMPGDMGEKMHPWLMPFQDVLRNIVGEVAPKVLSQFEILPLAHVRGRTLDKCVGILDEAQNCTLQQLRAYLTRIGEGGKLLVCGDPGQSDLPGGGRHLELLADELEREGVAAVIRFTPDMIVRHKVIASIERVFERMRNRGG